MKIDLTEKVAIVTGAAGGIGRKTLALLNATGASIVAEDINPTVKKLESLSDNIVTLQGEVAVTQTAKAQCWGKKQRSNRVKRGNSQAYRCREPTAATASGGCSHSDSAADL